jgi:integrase
VARKINRLNARSVATIRKPGRHADGGNLYLSVSPTGAKSWVFLFRWHGKPTELGFGSARSVLLAQARDLAAEARTKLAAGIKPTGPRSSSGARTFGEVADGVLEAMRPSWRSRRHAQQWETTLRDLAASLRNLPVAQIATEDVLTVLKPLWKTTPVTASRLRGRIERVLDAAKAQGLRSGENPARWRGHLDQLLPGRQRLARGHYAAMPYADVPGFLVRLRAEGTTAALALEFAILTAARTSEVRFATRDEFDLDAKLWTVPPARTKAGQEHRVPLSNRAVEIIAQLDVVRGGEFVFERRKPGSPLSMNAMQLVLARMGVTAATVHGFRSSFRDWAGDCTHHPRDVIEAALAHAIENQTEAAYRRGTAIEKRRTLMVMWDGFLEGKVVSLGHQEEVQAGA